MQTEGRSITIEEAEQGRQQRVTAGLKSRIPALYDRALQALLAQKRAYAEMAAVKLELAGAVTPSQVTDVMDEIDRETTATMGADKGAKTAAQGEIASQPSGARFAMSDLNAKGAVPDIEATPKRAAKN
jgi:hypothetical protein